MKLYPRRLCRRWRGLIVVRKGADRIASCAANPKFAQHCRTYGCELRVQSGTRIIGFLVSSIPKFASWRAASLSELRNRDTSRARATRVWLHPRGRSVLTMDADAYKRQAAARALDFVSAG